MASVGALMLLAAVAATAYAGDDAPITGAEVAPAATATSSAGTSSTTPSIVEAPPAIKASVASEPAKALADVATHAEDPGEDPGEHPGMIPTRPTFTTPAVPPMDKPGDDAVLTGAAGTQEIPRATPEEAPVAMVPPGAVPSSSDLSSYMNDDPDLASGIGSVRDFVAEGEESSPIGFEVRETRRKLKSGEEASGLLILRVAKDSPAGRAGLRPYKRAAHNVIEGVAIGAALMFPPAILAIPVIDYTEVGESYDMIIGIDGSRVTNFLDFEERMHDVQAGELVYFSVVRNGRRMQIAVPVPALSTSASE